MLCVLPEESPGGGGQQVVHHRPRTCPHYYYHLTDHSPAARTLPPYCHPGLVSPKLENILLDPVKRQALVSQPLDKVVLRKKQCSRYYFIKFILIDIEYR